MLVAGVGSFVVRPEYGSAPAILARNAIDLVVLIPFFALFGRRLHDINRSAWWTLALPPVVAANIYDELRVNFHAYDAAWPELGMWKLLLLIPLLLAFAVILQPGDVGPNRYGPDPRRDVQEAGTL